jgi:succinate-acetate transporter protein
MKASAARTPLCVALTAVVFSFRIFTVIIIIASACIASRRRACYASLALFLFLIISTQVDARRVVRNAALAGGMAMPSTALAERSLAR